jgi:hypothetical protein
MKKLTITALLAGQLIFATQPSAAAELAESRTQQMGGFAGLRVRMPLDHRSSERRIRAGVALAPVMQSRTLGGETRSRIGEGLELGITGREPVRLSVAGTPVSRLAQGPLGPDGRRLGVSTTGWIAIGTGIALTAVVIGWVILDNSGNCCE